MDYRILVVEDDAVISAAVAGHISSWGCQVRRAENFADIMSEFNEFEPQLVLLDISLPATTGAARYARSRACPSSSYPARRTT